MCYLYVAVDRAIRWIYVVTRPLQFAKDVRAFMQRVEEKALFTIRTVLMNKVRSFIDRFMVGGECLPGGYHLFDQECQCRRHGLNFD